MLDKIVKLSTHGIALSWLIGVTPKLGGPDFLLREQLLPALPSVTLPIGTRSDVVSLVPYLFRAIAISLLACTFVEPAKFRAGKRLQSGRLYLLVLTYQAVLLIDLFRFYAYDWFIYALHFARLLDLNDQGSSIKRWVVVGAPWPSCLFMLGLMFILSRAHSRTTVDSHERI